MLRPVIYLLIEVSRRELVPSYVLSGLCLQADFDVVIISKYWFEYLIDRNFPLPAGAVYVKDLSHRSFFQGMESAIKKGFKIYCRFAECVDKKSHRFISPLTYPSYYMSGVTLLASVSSDLVIYKELAEYFNYSVPMMKFLDPRFIVLDSFMSEYISKLASPLKRFYGDFSMFSVSARPKSLDTASLVTRTRRWFEGNDKITDKEIEDYILYRSQLGAAYSSQSEIAIGVLEDIIGETDHRFLISAHPAGRADAVEDYKHILSRFQNTDITFFGSYEPKLLAADRYYSACCTTSVIASIMGCHNRVSFIGKDLHEILHTDTLYGDLLAGNLASSLCADVETTLDSLRQIRDEIPIPQNDYIQKLNSLDLRNLPKSWKFDFFRDEDVKQALDIASYTYAQCAKSNAINCQSLTPISIQLSSS